MTVDASNIQDSSLRNFYAAFPPDKPAGSATVPCPLAQRAEAIPAKPCNLSILKVTEPQASPKGKPGTRTVQLRMEPSPPQILTRGELLTGGVFQITATSSRQGKRSLSFQSQREACCGRPEHKKLAVIRIDDYEEHPGDSLELQLCRAEIAGDRGVTTPLWTLINGLLAACGKPERWSIVAESCALPAAVSNAPARSLTATIEVFPADEFELELEIPSILSPLNLSLDKATDNWKSIEGRADVGRPQQRDSYFEKVGDFMARAFSTRADIKRYKENLAKQASGEDDESFTDGLNISLTRTDGAAETAFSTEEARKLVRFIRQAEYRIKTITEWFNTAAIGPGASFAVECQFLTGSLTATWGRREYVDHRVFLAWEGEFAVQLIKLAVTLKIGVQYMGFADLFVEVTGEGAISLGGSASCDSPGGATECKLVKKGELELGIALKSQLFWSVQCAASLKCSFEADAEELSFMKEGHILQGSVTISREAVNGAVTFACGMMEVFQGAMEIMPSNDEVAKFEFN